MGISLRDSERLWGTFYALLHFLAVPELFSWATALWQLPGWVSTVGISFLNALCSFLIYRHFLLASLKGQHWPRLLGIAFLGLGLYFAASGLFSFLVSRLYPAFANFNDGRVARQIAQGGIPMLLAVTLAAPLGEEIIFRGLLFRGLYDRCPPAAWCLSAVLFSLLHIVGYLGQYSGIGILLAFLQYLPAGICLCLVYRLSGTFLCPVLVHCIINLIGVIAIS